MLTKVKVQAFKESDGELKDCPLMRLALSDYLDDCFNVISAKEEEHLSIIVEVRVGDKTEAEFKLFDRTEGLILEDKVVTNYIEEAAACICAKCDKEVFQNLAVKAGSHNKTLHCGPEL